MTWAASCLTWRYSRYWDSLLSLDLMWFFKWPLTLTTETVYCFCWWLDRPKIALLDWRLRVWDPVVTPYFSGTTADSAWQSRESIVILRRRTRGPFVTVSFWRSFLFECLFRKSVPPLLLSLMCSSCCFFDCDVLSVDLVSLVPRVSFGCAVFFFSLLVWDVDVSRCVSHFGEGRWMSCRSLLCLFQSLFSRLTAFSRLFRGLLFPANFFALPLLLWQL